MIAMGQLNSPEDNPKEVLGEILQLEPVSSQGGPDFEEGLPGNSNDSEMIPLENDTTSTDSTGIAWPDNTISVIRERCLSFENGIAASRQT